MYTEEEAKTKWCKDRSMSYQIIIGTTLMTLNKTCGEDILEYIEKTKGQDSNCIGSACMMGWRWENNEPPILDHKFEINPLDTIYGNVCKKCGGSKKMHKPKGYCGIGGKP